MDHDHHSKSQKGGPRACSVCAKAKARCIPGPANGICERCHRLKKPCSSQTPAPPRKRKDPKPTRVAELERRLQDLTARIESTTTTTTTQQVPPPPRLPPTPSDSAESPAAVSVAASAEKPRRSHWKETIFPPQPAFGHIFPVDELQDEDGDGDVGHHHHHQRPACRSPSGDVRNGATPESPGAGSRRGFNALAGTLGIATPAGWMQSDSEWDARKPAVPRRHEVPCSSPATSNSLWPQGEEAERFLEDYRVYMAPLFPFVTIPAEFTSEGMQQRRPLLWKAVMMQGCHLDGARQVVLAGELLNELVTGAFMKPKKSFDMLQALLVMVAWFHVNLQSFQMTNLLFLMRSICVCLGFYETKDNLLRQTEISSHCMEAMRAYVGVYHVVTMVFTTNKKPDAFMDTGYLDDCCRIMERQMEYPSDLLVVYVIRIQQLSQSISMTLDFRERTLQTDLPLMILVKSFQQQIEQFRASVPDTLRDDPLLMTQINIAEMLIYETGLKASLAAHLALTDRLELLWSCLNSVRSFLEVRFAHSVVERPRFNCMASFDFVYAMIICLKLSTLTAPGWDLRIVRRELEFDKFIDRQVLDLKAVADRRRGKGRGGGAVAVAAAVQQQEDPFDRLARRLQSLRDSLRIELDASLPPDASSSSSAMEVDLPPAAATAAAAGEADMGGLFGGEGGQGGGSSIVQYSDVAFWQDLYRMNGWENVPVDGWDDLGGPLGAL